MRIEDYEKEKVMDEIKKILRLLFWTVAVLAVLALGFYNSAQGFDKHIQNQDTMLCESAKISGNIEYQQKCSCYFKSGNITCLNK